MGSDVYNGDSLDKLPFYRGAYSYLRDQTLVISSAAETKAEFIKSLRVIDSAEVWDDNIESTKFPKTDDTSRPCWAGNDFWYAAGESDDR